MNSIDSFIATGEQATREETCPDHGVYQSRNVFRKIWTRCPVCAELQKAKEDEDRAAEKKNREEQVWQKRIGDSGIPERFSDRSLTSYIAETDAQRKALLFATDYANHFKVALTTGRSALFIGKPGTGKTHLAIGIGLRIMARDRRSVVFTTVMRAIRRIKDTWNTASRGGPTETEVIDAFVRPDLLILDEIGIQFGSDTEKNLLFDILNGRYEERRPTLLLSNLALPDVRAFLGERVFDRLREDGGEALIFDWDSHRGRMGVKNENV
jgi:DNA replication protein DnaC